MSRFKDFDAARAEYQSEPIGFKLGGREWTASNVDAEQFLGFVRQASAGGDQLVLAFADLMDASLPEKDREVFHVMLHDQGIPITLLIEVAKWIVEQAAGNPTDAASPSGQHASRPGRRPRVVSLSGGSRSRGTRSAAG